MNRAKQVVDGWRKWTNQSFLRGFIITSKLAKTSQQKSMWAAAFQYTALWIGKKTIHHFPFCALTKSRGYFGSNFSILRIKWASLQSIGNISCEELDLLHCNNHKNVAASVVAQLTSLHLHLTRQFSNALFMPTLCEHNDVNAIFYLSVCPVSCLCSSFLSSLQTAKKALTNTADSELSLAGYCDIVLDAHKVINSFSSVPSDF